MGYWAGVFRAIEVAKTGGHSVTVYFDPEYRAGFDDYKSIKAFCKGWFGDFAAAGDIFVELIKPQPGENKRRRETLPEISDRVFDAMQRTKPDLILSGASETLINKATELFGYSVAQAERAKHIASTIARMDYSKNIEAIHIAEALGYTNYRRDVCLAEAEFITFGDMVFIKNGHIEAETVKKAIEYLSGLLK